MLKRIATIFLLLLFVFNIFGVYLAFKIKQTLIKKEIKALIKNTSSDDQLTLILETSSNKKDFEWEHSREFRYKGEMYDIVKKADKPDGSILYYCISDKEETALLNSFSKTISNTLDPCGKANDFSKKISQFFSTFYYFTQAESFNTYRNSTKIFTENVKDFILFISEILLPPPKFS